MGGLPAVVLLHMCFHLPALPTPRPALPAHHVSAVLPLPPCLPACLLRSDSLWEDYKLAKFVPFNPTDKFTIAFVQDVKTGVIERVMKGAPQVGGWVRRVAGCGGWAGGRAGGLAAARYHFRACSDGRFIWSMSFQPVAVPVPAPAPSSPPPNLTTRALAEPRASC